MPIGVEKSSKVLLQPESGYPGKMTLRPQAGPQSWRCRNRDWSYGRLLIKVPLQPKSPVRARSFDHDLAKTPLARLDGKL
jgi:hypothetical protein